LTTHSKLVGKRRARENFAAVSISVALPAQVSILIHPTEARGMRTQSREYRSTTTLFGLPLVHIATGIDPATGRKRVAKGIVALGHIAVGVIACGGVAVGGVTLGGVSLGVLSLGGLSVGVLLAIGGCALGAGLSFGGLAVSTIAVGGMAVGYYAIGGGTAGVHTLSRIHVDPEVEKLITPWAMNWSQAGPMFALFLPISCLILFGIVAISFFTKTGAPLEGPASDFGSPLERTAP